MRAAPSRRVALHRDAHPPLVGWKLRGDRRTRTIAASAVPPEWHAQITNAAPDGRADTTPQAHAAPTGFRKSMT